MPATMPGIRAALHKSFIGLPRTHVRVTFAFRSILLYILLYFLLLPASDVSNSIKLIVEGIPLPRK